MDPRRTPLLSLLLCLFSPPTCGSSSLLAGGPSLPFCQCLNSHQCGSYMTYACKNPPYFPFTCRKVFVHPVLMQRDILQPCQSRVPLLGMQAVSQVYWHFCQKHSLPLYHSVLCCLFFPLCPSTPGMLWGQLLSPGTKTLRSIRGHRFTHSNSSSRTHLPETSLASSFLLIPVLMSLTRQRTWDWLWNDHSGPAEFLSLPGKLV